MSVFKFDEFIEKYSLPIHHVDKFGDKFKISEIITAYESYLSTPQTSDTLVPQETEKGAESPHDVYAYTVEITDMITEDDGYIAVPHKEIALFEKVALYSKNSNGLFILYKPENSRLNEDRIADYRCPMLYFHNDDKANALIEKLTEYSNILDTMLSENIIPEAQKLFVSIFKTALTNTDPSILVQIRHSVEITVKYYTKDVDTLDIMCNVIGLDQGSSEHAVNLMGLAIKFCKSNDYSVEDTVDIAFSALLHDIGKPKLEFEGVTSEGLVPATPENRAIFEKHCEIGAHIIDQCNFSNPLIRLGALEHHEQLDGSGYPSGTKKISFYGQLIGMFHFFEHEMEKETAGLVTTKPLTILKMLKNDVDKGKYNSQLFKQFAYSLL